MYRHEILYECVFKGTCGEYESPIFSGSISTKDTLHHLHCALSVQTNSLFLPPFLQDSLQFAFHVMFKSPELMNFQEYSMYISLIVLEHG